MTQAKRNPIPQARCRNRWAASPFLMRTSEAAHPCALARVGPSVTAFPPTRVYGWVCPNVLDDVTAGLACISSLQLLSPPPILGTARGGALFPELLEQARRRYGFVVVAMSNAGALPLAHQRPERGTPSTVMQVLKQAFPGRILDRWARVTGQSQLWCQSCGRTCVAGRFYDFRGLEPCQRLEKLRYIHRNPVSAGRRCSRSNGGEQFSTLIAYDQAASGR